MSYIKIEKVPPAEFVIDNYSRVSIKYKLSASPDSSYIIAATDVEVKPDGTLVNPVYLATAEFGSYTVWVYSECNSTGIKKIFNKPFVPTTVITTAPPTTIPATTTVGEIDVCIIIESGSIQEDGVNNYYASGHAGTNVFADIEIAYSYKVDNGSWIAASSPLIIPQGANISSAFTFVVSGVLGVDNFETRIDSITPASVANYNYVVCS